MKPDRPFQVLKFRFREQQTPKTGMRFRGAFNCLIEAHQRESRRFPGFFTAFARRRRARSPGRSRGTRAQWLGNCLENRADREKKARVSIGKLHCLTRATIQSAADWLKRNDNGAPNLNVRAIQFFVPRHRFVARLNIFSFS